MRKDTQGLYLFAEEFKKEAGLIAVPKITLKKAQDYAIAVYSTHMASELDEKIAFSEYREKQVRLCSEWHTKWEDGSNLISNIIGTRDQGGLNELEAAWMKKSFPIIPKFFTGPDPNSSLEGFLGAKEDGSGIVFQFFRMDENKDLWHGYFKCDTPSSGELDELKFRSDKSGLSTNEAYKWLDEVRPLMNQAINNFQNFYNNMNVFGETSLKGMKFSSALFQKESYNLPDTLFGMSSEVFKIPTSDLPYNKSLPPEIKQILFSLKFENKPTNDYLGLWQRTNLIKNNGYIGTISVRSNVEKDIEEVIHLGYDRISWVKNKFSELREIVRHETQHLIQTFLHTISGEYDKDFNFGVGKRLREKDFDPNGVSRVKNEDIPRQDHSLRDIEFQTDLSDEVDKFNRLKTMLPTQLHQTYAYLWIGHISSEEFRKRAQEYLKIAKGPNDSWTGFNGKERDVNRLINSAVSKAHNSFFPALKSERLGKYQKAMKEFLRGTGFIG